MAEKPPEYDPFIIEKVFPSPEGLLKTEYPPIDTLIKSAVFVLDANTMLAPFLVGKDSLKDVEKVFRQLKKANRLFLPEQAIREYARHRASKIAEAYGHIQQRLSELPQNPKPIEISMFEGVPEYKAAVESSEAVRSAVKTYKAKLQDLQGRFRDWNYDDPVSKLYAELFTASQIVTHGKKPEDVSSDLTHRVLHSIPPGFKDKSKPDGGIGDVIIWHTILQVGRDKKKNVVFVTNDGKTDWMVKHGEEPLYPRFELVEEFHRETGQHFTILRFDRFLTTMGAGTTTVEEVRASANLRTFLHGTVTGKLRGIPPSSFEVAIRQIEDAVNEFVEPWSRDGDEEYSFIGGRFKDLVEVVMNLAPARLRTCCEAERVIVQPICLLLERMEALNSYIEYQSVRMKSSATEQQEELRQLANQLIELLDKLKPHY